MSDTLGGNTPGVSLWTARGEAIGGQFGSRHIVQDATPISYSISGNSSLGDRQAPAEYISITNGGDDAVCVSYVQVVEPTTQNTHMFLGEIGYGCHVDWYPSILTIANVMPKCIWLDRNRSNGLRYQGMGIHLPSFSNSDDSSKQGLAQQYKANVDSMCKSGPRFKMYETINGEDPILYFDPPFTEDDFNADGSDKDLKKIINNPGKMTAINWDLAGKACESHAGCPHLKDEIKHNPNNFKRQVKAPWDPDHLVVSHFEAHSAEEVCNSENSRGPDFLSMKEMKYCHMDTKTLWDVCSSASATCCFDVETQLMRACGYRVQGVSRTSIPSKRYNRVSHWGAEKGAPGGSDV